MTIRSAAAVIALALVTGSAAAADLPALKSPPPPPPPPPLWTGFYVGLNAGYTWSDSNRIDTKAWNVFNNGSVGGIEAAPLAAALAATSLGTNNGGFIGGGQIGYNYQFARTFLTGIEIDIQGVASNSNSVTALTGGITTINGPLAQVATASKKLDYLGTVRGRLGYLVTPTLLAYATGGLAYGGATVDASIAQVFVLNPAGNVGNPYFSAGRSSDTRVGWTIGGGLEWLFSPDWSAKVEYLYYDLGRTTFAQNPLANIGQTAGVGVFTVAQPFTSTRFNGHIVRAGVNYHFHWAAPAPILAKY